MAKIILNVAKRFRRSHVRIIKLSLSFKEDLISRHKGKVHLSNMIDQTIDAVQKLQILEKEWPNILYEIIRDTLVDYTEMNLYMKRCSKILEVDK